MKIFRQKFLPFPGFAAINLWGVLFVRPKTKITPTLLRHEMIHTMQIMEILLVTAIPFAVLAKFTSLAVLFGWLFSYYICYGFGYVIQLGKLGNFADAYRSNRFEAEAYKNETDNDYFLTRKWFAWARK